MRRGTTASPIDLIAPLCLFVVVLTFGWIWIDTVTEGRIEAQRQQTRATAQSQAAALELNLTRSISAARILGTYVEVQQGDTEDFEEHAAIIHGSLGGITNLQLAPDGIVRKIYPLAGHERALGHNLLKDDARRKEADLAIRTRQLTLAGPFKLVQGGVAVVARNPVFIRADSPQLVTDNSGSLQYARQGEEQFWGYASVLIYFDQVLGLTQISTLDSQGYDYRLWRHHPDTGMEETLSGLDLLAQTYAVTLPITLPNSRWFLSLTQREPPIDPVTLIGYWGANALLALLLAGWFYNLLRRPRELRALVAARTKELETAHLSLRLAATVFESHEAIAITDLEGNALQVNQAFCRITGYQADEVIGHTLPAWGTPSDRRTLLDLLKQRKDWEGEVTQVRSDGQSYPCWLSVSVVYNETGQPSHFVSHFIDISKRKAAEGALRSAMARAEAGSQAKSDFLAMMSHEIRTPLNGVLGLIDLVRDTALDATQRNYLDTAHKSGRALLEIINDVLDFSKMEAGRLELIHTPIPSAEFLDQLVALFEPQAATKGLKLQCDTQGDLPAHFIADAGRLRQVLVNLLGNACKFTQEGSVTLTVESTPLDAEHAQLRFAVSDTGPGIAHEDQQRLFERFTSLNSAASSERSTGLGLAISQQLVSLMGGELAVQSELGQGSCFYFTLRVEITTTAIAETRPLADNTPPEDAHLLIVEDVPVNQLIAREMLKKAGYRISVAANGREAVEQAKNTTFAAILMDISMPEMDGIEATQVIRTEPNRNQQTPIIAMTAHVLKEEEARCRVAGMNDYLTKPLDRAQLLQRVAQWVQPNALPGEE